MGKDILPESAMSAASPSVHFVLRGDQQLEINTTYARAHGQHSKQQFQVDAAIFFPEELQAVQTSPFSSMFQSATFHMPEATLDAFAQGPVKLEPPQVAFSKDGEVERLQVMACILRKAMRDAAKAAGAQLVAPGTPPAAAAMASKDLCVKMLCALSHLGQELQRMQHDQPSDELQKAADMVQEFMLFEAESLLLKLLQQSRGEPSEADTRPSSAASQLSVPEQSAGASAALMDGILAVQGLRTAQGFHTFDLLDKQDDNEAWIMHVKLLKRSARSSITLFHQERRPLVIHPVLVDVVGSIIAGISMLWAILAVYMGQRMAHVSITHNSLGGGIYTPAVLILTVLGYMLKDRMKIWGQRYLVPVAQAVGFDFPDRSAAIIDHRHKVMADYTESCSVMREGRIEPSLLAERRKSPEEASIPMRQERVLMHRKHMQLQWQHWSESTKSMTGLEDSVRYDLSSPFSRKMEPAYEAFYRLTGSKDGGYAVERVACARAYRLHVLVRVTAQNASGPHSRLHRCVVVMDKNGCKRLEDCDARTSA